MDERIKWISRRYYVGIVFPTENFLSGRTHGDVTNSRSSRAYRRGVFPEIIIPSARVHIITYRHFVYYQDAIRLDARRRQYYYRSEP